MNVLHILPCLVWQQYGELLVWQARVGFKHYSSCILIVITFYVLECAAFVKGGAHMWCKWSCVYVVQMGLAS